MLAQMGSRGSHPITGSYNSLHWLEKQQATGVKILRVSWTAKNTNEWDFSKAGVKKELSDASNSNEASILRSHHEQTRELLKNRTDIAGQSMDETSW